MQRFQNCVYKGPLDKGKFREILQGAARNVGARITWDVPGDPRTYLNTSDEGDIHKVQLTPLSPKADEFYKETGKISGFPWINFRIPGAPIWLYTLYSGEELKDSFNPCPEIWENPDTLTGNDLSKVTERWSGNANLLAKIWDVPEARIERYIRRWGLIKTSPTDAGYKYKLSGKAYPRDAAEYGKAEQLIDFWRALGISNNASSAHSMIMEIR